MSNDKKDHESFVLDVIAGLQAMGIVVYGERIAVVRDPEVEKIGSLYVPEEGKRKEPRGTVVAHGIGLAEMEASRTSFSECCQAGNQEHSAIRRACSASIRCWSTTAATTAAPWR